MAPRIGCHSVIDRPELVSRVKPPITTNRAMLAATSANQTPMASEGTVGSLPAVISPGTVPFVMFMVEPLGAENATATISASSTLGRRADSKHRDRAASKPWPLAQPDEPGPGAGAGYVWPG